MTSDRPYHHGNVRQAVLDQAATVIRDRGAAELSLRELAGAIGVTHAAPRRYFATRQELLDAVAVEGFARLGRTLQEAVDASSDYPDQVRLVARAYLDFMLAEANLVELMFAHKRGSGDAVGRSAAAALAPMLQMFRRAQDDGRLADRDAGQVGLIFLATLQGLAGLANCGVVPLGHLDDLIGDVVRRTPGTD